MNRSLSSKAAKKPSPATENKKKKKKKKKVQSPRNPLQDLNATIISTSNNVSEASASASSSISIEAPRGCLRFFLSHSSSSNLKTPIRSRAKTLSKTPKSAPVVRPSKTNENRSKCNVSKNPESRQVHKFKTSSSCLYHYSCRNGQKLKACPALNPKGNSLSKLESGSEEEGVARVVEDDVGQPSELKSGSGDGTSTPLSKIATGLGLDCKVNKTEDVQQNSDKSISTTPPVQASVSPEIQLGSSAVSSTSLACYAAGHVLSGITDKRKCRPRGILNVGENDSGFGKGKALCSFEHVEEDDHATVKGMVGNPDASMVPLPTEASMHWLLSPCNEEDEDQKEHSETSAGSPSPNSAREFSSDINLESSTGRSRRNTAISPSGVPKLKDETQYSYDFDSENSPFSMASLGSGNVILTPQSDSSADKHAGLSWSNADNHRKRYDSELSSVAEAIRMASLSPNRHVLIEDQIDSSFQFDCLTTTCNSISRIQKMLDDQASWQSNSTLSQSQLRISWREGLMSRMYDMDEYDSCRCLSDEEEDTDGCSNDLLKRSPEITNNVGGDQTLTDNSWSSEVGDDEPGVAGKIKQDFPHQSSCLCAESMSTDGGGLLASGDSDWNLCYKNELFHV